MLLRSSSTPVLGSLLSCLSESPNNNNPSDATTKHPPSTIHQAHNKLSLHQTGSLNLSSISCNSSPISPSVNSDHGGFRRAQSDGNLKGLACVSGNDDEFSTPNPHKKFSRRPNCSMLPTIPSFSVYGLRRCNEDEEGCEEEEENQEELEENDGERFMAMGEGVESRKIMELIRENGGRNVAVEEEEDLVGSELHLARGLGVGGVDVGGGSGGGGDFTPRGSGGESSDRPGMEEYYKRMVEENPSNPLFLRNYAQFLYQVRTFVYLLQFLYQISLPDKKEYNLSNLLESKTEIFSYQYSFNIFVYHFDSQSMITKEQRNTWLEPFWQIRKTVKSCPNMQS